MGLRRVGKQARLTILLNFDHACQLGIADIKLVFCGEGESQAKATNVGDFFDASFFGDAIDLSYFAARPKYALAIESEILSMIQTVCVGLKLVNGICTSTLLLTPLSHRQLRQ